MPLSDTLDRAIDWPAERKNWPKVVVFDTSGPWCALGATFKSYSSSRLVEMKRGQAERLMPLLEEFISSGGWSWDDVDAIGVGVGPGNFTGTRIAVAAARGLGLGLKVPVFGVSMFELVADRCSGRTLVSLPGPKAQVYVQQMRGGIAAGPTMLIDPTDPTGGLDLSFGVEVTGYLGEEIGRRLGIPGSDQPVVPQSEHFAEYVEHRYLMDENWPPRPAPLYIRPPDAAPPSDPPPVILP